MGAVYEAADLRLARPVAVKIMLGRAFGDRQAVRRFEREAQAREPPQPNTMSVFDYGGVGPTSRSSRWSSKRTNAVRGAERQGRIFPQSRARPRRPDLRGRRDRARARRIVHRDLKPENVIVLDEQQDRRRPR